MIASLPMYLRPENRGAHDVYYRLIRDALRDHGVAAPDALSHDAPVWDTWSNPELVLGQICNLPYRAAFKDKVTLIAAADYGLPDTAPGTYYSVLIARKNDDPDPKAYADRILAFNEPGSQSGWAAPQAWGDLNGVTWSNPMATGAHVASAKAIAEGRADIAAIDAQSWRNISRYDDFAKGLHIIGRTPSSPGLSYITAADRDPAPFRAALSQAITAIPSAAKDALDIEGIMILPESDYTDLPLPRLPAAA